MTGWLAALSSETAIVVALFSWITLRLVRQLDANTRAIVHLEKALFQVASKLHSHIEVHR